MTLPMRCRLGSSVGGDEPSIHIPQSEEDPVTMVGSPKDARIFRFSHTSSHCFYLCDSTGYWQHDPHLFCLFGGICLPVIRRWLRRQNARRSRMCGLDRRGTHHLSLCGHTRDPRRCPPHRDPAQILPFAPMKPSSLAREERVPISLQPPTS